MSGMSITGIPSDIDRSARIAFEVRLKAILGQVCEASRSERITLSLVANRSPTDGQEMGLDDVTAEKGLDHLRESMSSQYQPIEPRYGFERLVLPEAIREEILTALAQMQFEARVFDEWGLREIEPFPRTALNFHGPAGTGKTMAAHAAASYLGKRICLVSYADVESKYHGDGPKNVAAVFAAAEADGALLFFDEADSLLSRRLTNVSQGSEQAINSMRSQLLICLERHRGVVIFATNLVENYDSAFNTRVRHVKFSLPDQECRSRIWRSHIPELLPLSSNVDCDTLAATFESVCGREIKNAVIAAAIDVAKSGRNLVEHSDFERAMRGLIASRVDEVQPRWTARPVSSGEFNELSDSIRSAIGGGMDREVSRSIQGEGG